MGQTGQGASREPPRVASRLLERALAAFPVIVLMGARQTGKSTLVRSEPFLEDRLYLTLDDLETREHAGLDAEDLLRSATRLTLDEVQRDPELLLAVKRAVDGDRPRRNGRFVLTGSANLLRIATGFGHDEYHVAVARGENEMAPATESIFLTEYRVMILSDQALARRRWCDGRGGPHRR